MLVDCRLFGEEKMVLYCPKCGSQVPDESYFCMKCGASLADLQKKTETASPAAPILAPIDATSLKCPSCGSSIVPKFGEMIITCSSCGTGVVLGKEGWKSVQKQSMLPISLGNKDDVTGKIRGLMDKGFLHRHLQENSVLEETTLSLVPYWIISASVRTFIVAADAMSSVGQTATAAAILDLLLGGIGGMGRGGYERRFLAPSLLSGGSMVDTMVKDGDGGQGGPRKTYEFDKNYDFPIVAVKSLTEYQPKNHQFRLEDRVLFDISKIPRGVGILNGDIGEEAANFQAKTLAAQLQSDKANADHDMIQQLNTDIDITVSELLHAPIWFVRYDFKGNKIVLVIDADSGNVINSIGLSRAL